MVWKISGLPQQGLKVFHISKSQHVRKLRSTLCSTHSLQFFPQILVTPISFKSYFQFFFHFFSWLRLSKFKIERKEEALILLKKVVIYPLKNQLEFIRFLLTPISGIRLTKVVFCSRVKGIFLLCQPSFNFNLLVGSLSFCAMFRNNSLYQHFRLFIES